VQEDFQTVRATEEAETIQDWLLLDGKPGFQLLTEEEIVTVIFFYVFSLALPVLLNFFLLRPSFDLLI
jgi:hypothetical protein